jgi:23S rRNA (guanine745-N1)-methyltransferase
MEHYVNILVCPLCGAPLAHAGNAFRCPNRHSFDIARGGYVNFLRSGRSGDTREMLHARRNFLERGYYTPLSEAINALAADQLKGMPAGADILDAGCGEGYYLRELKRHLDRRPAQAPDVYIGLDISGAAVCMAARRMRAQNDRAICFVVADIVDQVPCANSSIDLLLNIFAPRNPHEFARVTAPHGLLLIAIPTPKHLTEPRSALGLLNIGADKRERTVEQLAPWFRLADSRTLEYAVSLDRDDLVNLVTMTPNYWHRANVRWSALPMIVGEPTTISMTILAFHRRA